ncbi:MAG: HAD hydrolase family protein [Candidatus Aminicenantes bacterium]|nr:HAD hydrolase family protein [Candidatus Aminicenantes bacterium]
MDLKQQAARIRLILMDVDGTLTDGTITVLPDGEELKSYHVRDGMGILMAQLVGIDTGIITGKTSRALEKRASRLKMKFLYQGILDKGAALKKVLSETGLSAKDVAYIGDDLGDLSVIKSVGLSAAVADAHDMVKKHCHMICSLPGGAGAVREFIEFILEAQEHDWDSIETKLLALERLKSLKI